MALPATHIRFAAALADGLAITDMAAYLDLVRNAYPRNGAPAWPDYVKLWAGVGLELERIEKIELQVKQIQADGVLVDRLQDTFDQMVRRYVGSDVEPISIKESL
jgi:hypothetical protein